MSLEKEKGCIYWRKLNGAKKTTRSAKVPATSIVASAGLRDDLQGKQVFLEILLNSLEYVV